MAPRREKVVTVQRLMAVIDKPEAASLAAGALVREGFPAEAITVLHGDRDADRVDSLGKMSGPWRKLWRAVQFTQADQMVDLVMYEAALRDGISRLQAAAFAVLTGVSIAALFTGGLLPGLVLALAGAAFGAAVTGLRPVIAVHARRAEDRERAKRVLAAAGAHFMNYFGRLSTEDISRWRGKELPLHPILYR